MKKYRQVIAALALALPIGVLAVNAAEANSSRNRHGGPGYSQTYGQNVYGTRHGGYQARRAWRNHAAKPWSRYGSQRRAHNGYRRW